MSKRSIALTWLFTERRGPGAIEPDQRWPVGNVRLDRNQRGQGRARVWRDPAGSMMVLRRCRLADQEAEVVMEGASLLECEIGVLVAAVDFDAHRDTGGGAGRLAEMRPDGGTPEGAFIATAVVDVHPAGHRPVGVVVGYGVTVVGFVAAPRRAGRVSRRIGGIGRLIWPGRTERTWKRRECWARRVPSMGGRCLGPGRSSTSGRVRLSTAWPSRTLRGYAAQSGRASRRG